MQNLNDNPFVRGYQQFSIQRLAMVYSATMPWHLFYIPLHSSQENLRDYEVENRDVIFSHQYALIESASVTDEQKSECNSKGRLIKMIYRINAVSDFNSFGDVIIGHARSKEGAERIVSNISFSKGQFSRCWEINTSHLPYNDLRKLIDGISIDPPLIRGKELMDFHILGDYSDTYEPMSPRGIGVKLSFTPWTDENLTKELSVDSEIARSIFLAHGVPESFVDIAFLAANADVRMLIFDKYAEKLGGLPDFGGW